MTEAVIEARDGSSSEDTGDEVYEAHFASLRRRGYFQAPEPFWDELRRSSCRGRTQPGLCEESSDSGGGRDASTDGRGRGKWFRLLATAYGPRYDGGSAARPPPQALPQALSASFSVPLICTPPAGGGSAEAAAALGMSLPPDCLA